MTDDANFTSVISGVSKRSRPSLPLVCHAGGTTKMRVGRYQPNEAQFPATVCQMTGGVGEMTGGVGEMTGGFGEMTA